MADTRDYILDFYESKAPNKTKFMISDVFKGTKKIYEKKEEGEFPYKLRTFKKEIEKMVVADELKYWSSGSTTYLELAKPLDEIRKGGLEEKLEE